MYTVSDEVKAIINSDSPHYHSYLEFADFTLTNDYIHSITAQHASVSGEDLVPGAIISQTITVEAELTDNQIKGKYFYWKIAAVDTTGNEVGEKIWMGKFTVNECAKVNNHYKIEASDSISKSDKTYNPTLSFPAWSEDIIEDICDKIGIGYDCQEGGRFITSDGSYFYTADNESFKVQGFNYLIDKPVEHATMRQMLSYIAGIQGKFGYVESGGDFILSDFQEVSEDIFTDKVDGPEINESEVGIYRVRCTLDEKGENYIIAYPITYGLITDEVTFFNPYMTNLLLKQIAKSWVWRYIPCEVQLRIADPRIEICDLYKFEGKNLPVMQIERKYDGGFTSTIKATVSNQEVSN